MWVLETLACGTYRQCMIRDTLYHAIIYSESMLKCLKNLFLQHPYDENNIENYMLPIYSPYVCFKYVAYNTEMYVVIIFRYYLNFH